MWESSGWCEEVQCWLWDGWDGGNQSLCEDNEYGLNCIWDSNGAGGENDGWCYMDYSAVNCQNISSERDCMDTFYCWWEYNDWNNPSQGGNCSEPNWGSVGGGSGTSLIEDWNPGCYLFDMNETSCNNVLGCNYSNGLCDPITSGDLSNYGTNISNDGITCSYINNSKLCNSISMLSSCCSWQNGSCETNRMTSSCWDDIKEPPEGASFCEDYNSYTSEALCGQIAGDPWYMPCKWNNSSERCEFKASNVFGNETHSLIKIENKKNCESAGGKWIIENYCEATDNGWVSVPSGRCEYKFDEERNCDKACFACEYQSDGTNHSSLEDAKIACLNSELGFCGFEENSAAPNDFGYCEAKDQFKRGIAEDCSNTNCGACTFMGDPLGTNNTKTPREYCNENRDCKWITDNSTDTQGYCLSKSEKTCEDVCDRCYTRTDCTNIGRTKLTNGTKGSCEWEGTDNEGSCVLNTGDESEICWDGIDNNDDGLIDCGDPSCYSDSFCGFVSGDCFGWGDNTSCINNGCDWINDSWNPSGWCDYPGANCWQSDENEATCNTNDNCEWHNSSGSSWCELDWSIAEQCMGLNRTNCADTADCVWTNDSWCNGMGSGTEWCETVGGWCDHVDFQPKNCWQKESSLSCNAVDGCSWQTGESEVYCEVNWSGNCWQYTTNSTCTEGGCWWNPTSNWCGALQEQCWYYDQGASNDDPGTNCLAATDGDGNQLCKWNVNNAGGWAFCEPGCFDYNSNSSGCNALGGCVWKEESGWCEEVHMNACYNDTNTNNQTNCDSTSGCRWKDSGWCDPKDGFSAGAISGGGGIGGAMGSECYKYDGNQAMCTNSSLINISCGWFPEFYPWCDVDWSQDCWQYNDESSCTNNSCWWNSDQWGSWCTNVMDQCWMNNTLQNDADACNTNQYCNYTTWNSCEPTCFSSTTQGECSNSGCRWVDGWCNPAGMNNMFDGMENGAPVQIGGDICDGSETSQPSVDICGFGMKDMGDSYGFGSNVANFENASICNKEKISSMFMGPGGSSDKVGNGNDTIKFYVYLDTDGETTGSCPLSHNSSAEGYEFRLKYASEWSMNKSKAVESYVAYKCSNSQWKATDIKLSAWKKKMCGEIGGPMIAIEKDDLARFPTLYDSTKDIRVAVAMADGTHNSTSPSDIVDAGWTTPGAIDFEIMDMFSYDADMAKFEDILKKGFVGYEDCFNGVDDDNDNSTDCWDWDCQFAKVCEGAGVNTISDTRAPQVIGVKIEEYPDSALIMFDTNKPTNGTLEFYGNDSRCGTLNATIYDSGILNEDVRTYKLWHKTDIYSDNIGYDLTNVTTYYYKLKVCDNGGKCAVSRCSNFTTAATPKCGYCNFVTKIKAGSGWNVYYDVNQNGSYEHWQGHVCGSNAGMKTNYSEGRKVNIKLEKLDGGVYFEFINASLTKSGLNDKVRTISGSGDIIGTSSVVGLTSETRDKIINNLHPEECRIKVPFSDSCDALYHCDDNGENCIDRTAEATLLDATNCVWQVPYCEFSTYRESLTSSTTDEDTSSSGGGGGGGGNATTTTVEEDDEDEDKEEGKTDVSDSNSPITTATTGSGLPRLDDLSENTKNGLLIGFISFIALAGLVGSYFAYKHFEANSLKKKVKVKSGQYVKVH